MKKIGIMTIHKSPNYGASLQSFGLYKFLEEQGYNVEIIDLHRPMHSDYVPSKKYVPFRQKHKNVLQKIKAFFVKGKKTAENLLTLEAQQKFKDFNGLIKLSRAYLGIDDLYRNPPIYDVYLSGSDQLWNPTMRFCIEPYFLTFVKGNKKKISYATSIGINELRDNEKELYRSWLQQYGRVSVREKSAQHLLKSFCDVDVEQVADPSFLLDREEWKSLSIRPNVGKPYILLFTLSYSEELLNFAQRMQKESGKELVYLCTDKQNIDGNFIYEKSAGPKEWLGYIANADIVFTNSFHGTVFSIIMQAKNFYSYVPTTQKRGKRITDLLETFGLSDHCFVEDDLQRPFSEFIGKVIDLEKTTQTYLKEQTRSRKFLLDSVNE